MQLCALRCRERIQDIFCVFLNIINEGFWSNVVWSLYLQGPTECSVMKRGNFLDCTTPNGDGLWLRVICCFARLGWEGSRWHDLAPERRAGRVGTESGDQIRCMLSGFAPSDESLGSLCPCVIGRQSRNTLKGAQTPSTQSRVRAEGSSRRETDTWETNDNKRKITRKKMWKSVFHT